MSEYSRQMNTIWKYAIMTFLLQCISLSLFLIQGNIYYNILNLTIVLLIVFSSIIDFFLFFLTRYKNIELFDHPKKGTHVWMPKIDKENKIFVFDRSSVNDLPPPPPELLIKMNNGKIRCPICYSIIEHNSKFCPNCGLKIY